MGTTDRKRIADALYMLGAGADPDTFLRTLRAYVLQYTETTEQMAELIRDLSSANPPAFAEAIQAYAPKIQQYTSAEHAARLAQDDLLTVAVTKTAKLMTQKKASSKKRIKGKRSAEKASSRRARSAIT